MSKFLHDGEQPEPCVFLQWKGTNACMDFYYKCGAHCHFDGYFAYAVKCPHCHTIWEMPSILIPRVADDKTYKGHVEMANVMEPDEDYSDEVVEPDGITRLVPHKLPSSATKI